MAALAALARGAGANAAGSPGTGSGPGPSPGRAQGGQARRGEEGNVQDADSRIRGDLDPKGRLGPSTPFHGIPDPNEARTAFDATIRQAAAAAEEGIDQEEVPRSARPFVRRYFDALKPK